MEPSEAWLHLFFIVAMLIVGVGGFVAIVILWYTRGRDPAIGVVADIIPEPPDDLPPGAAGTLLDERVHHRDVVATLLGLGRHGAIQIVDRSVDDPARGGARGHDYLLIARDPQKVTSRLERDLLQVLYGHIPEPGEEVHLRNVKHRFDGHEAEIRDDLYQEMVDRDYFKKSPSETRRRWRLAWIGLVSSLVIGIFLTARVDSFAILTTIAAIIIWAGLLRMSTAMPRKTPFGTESAAKWRAFKRYLESIERHGALEEAQGIFDRYLSYAVAFGIERDWIRKFAQVGASSPGWFHEVGGPGGPGGYGRPGDVLIDTWMTGQMLGHLGGGPGNAFGGDAGMPNVDVPNIGMPDMPNMPGGGMQDVADAFGGGLQDTSEGLAGMLDEAGSVFDGIDFDF